MEDSYINNMSLNRSYNGCVIYNIIIHSFNRDFMYVLQCIVICLGLPLTLAAIYGVFSLIKNDHVAPIFIINLLISDLIQLCCLTAEVAKSDRDTHIPMFKGINDMIYFFGLTTSICFMMCIALERYLVIAWPLWYRFRRNIKTSVVISVVVWIFTLVVNLVVYFSLSSKSREILYAVFLLLPLPLFIFFLFGTIKALSAAISVPPDEKRRIVAILVLVLLIYTLLFLPTIILVLVKELRWNSDLWYLSFIFVKLSPLADLFLYILLRKGSTDTFLASVCCCRMDSDSDISRRRQKEEKKTEVVNQANQTN